MTSLLDKASSEAEWGTPFILYGLEAMADADPAQAERLIVFLTDRPASSFKPAIVPRLGARDWGKRAIIALGRRTDLSGPFLKALNQGLTAGK